MEVRVRTILGLVEVLGARDLALEVPEGTTVAGILAALIGGMGEEDARAFVTPDGQPRPHLRLLVNGRQITFLQGLETVLAEGDEVLLLPAAAGG